MGMDSPTTERNSFLNNNIQDSGLSSQNSTKSSGTPSIPDRSLKAKLLIRSSEQLRPAVTQESTGDKIQQVLDAEDDLIEDSLELQKKQLAMEQQWEMLRLRREKEAEENMKELILQKEDDLLEELKRLGDEKEIKDAENEKLREQLKEVKDKLNLESAWRQKLEGEQEKQEAIRKKAIEQQQLKEEVERKRQERRRKQQEGLEERKRRLQEAEDKSKQVERDLVLAELASQRHAADKQKLIASKILEDSSISKIPLKEEDEYRGRFNRGGGGLNRALSHSSPNIAKMLDEEDAAAAGKLNIQMP